MATILPKRDPQGYLDAMDFEPSDRPESDEEAEADTLEMMAEMGIAPKDLPDNEDRKEYEAFLKARRAQ